MAPLPGLMRHTPLIFAKRQTLVFSRFVLLSFLAIECKMEDRLIQLVVDQPHRYIHNADG